MGTISARLPDELEAELEAYLDEEHLDRSTAVRKLLDEGLAEWHRKQALERLADRSPSREQPQLPTGSSGISQDLPVTGTSLGSTGSTSWLN